MRALATAATAPQLTSSSPAVVAGETGASTTATAESPYPGEGEYPPATTPETRPESPLAEEFISEAAAPRILPPSTGEPVPAARPGSLAGQAESPVVEAAITPTDEPHTEAKQIEPEQPLPEPVKTHD
jgi:hypothetical protein